MAASMMRTTRSCAGASTSRAPTQAPCLAPTALPRPQGPRPAAVIPALLTPSSVSASHSAPRCSAVRPLAASATAAAPTPTSSNSRTPPANQKPTCIITGASSGLGLNAANALVASGDWHVIMACRDYAKTEKAARRLGMNKNDYTIMHLDLAALDSVRGFVEQFKASGRRLDALVCNAAVYLPTAKEPEWTADGFELSVGTNHLGHFLLARLLLDDLKEAPNGQPRLVIVGSITGNTNTLAGNVPPKADLGELEGLRTGGVNVPMINAGEFDGAKAYKDSKVCNMLTMREMHRRFHADTGITFASLYPGCIAETQLFRNHVPLFRKLFPPFQKFVTKGYVSEVDAGKRLAQVVSDPKLNKSGVYWSWNSIAGSFENQVSEEVADDNKAKALYEVSEKLVGLA